MLFDRCELISRVIWICLYLESRGFKSEEEERTYSTYAKRYEPL